MKMALRRAGCGLAFVAGVFVGPVMAQPLGSTPYGAWGDGSARHGMPVRGYPAPFDDGGRCVVWCVADASPCDPDYYKVADRRCNSNLNGVFSK